jgi:SAM-dependent methyltransferase
MSTAQTTNNRGRKDNLMRGTTLNHEAVKEYYGKTLQGSADLKTSACCCSSDELSPHVKAALALVDDEILRRFYGCGSPLPPLLEGCTILDLGCGTGRDAYVAARLAGPHGRVIGVDMTEEQLAVARRHVDGHMRRFGHDTTTVDFRHGYMEDLRALDIGDASVDVVISNCVLNLAPDKRSVFSEIFRVLKPGGELFVADVFADRRIPEALHGDPVLHGECLAGALYREDFRRLLADLGCPDYRITASRRLSVDDPEIAARIGMVGFHSETVRAFKLNNLEDRCEDYGQLATYHGTISDWAHHFDLDEHHRFLTGKPMLVCGNTAAMLSLTRYAKHFTIQGDRSRHFGLFACAPASAKPETESSGGACC